MRRRYPPVVDALRDMLAGDGANRDGCSVGPEHCPGVAMDLRRDLQLLDEAVRINFSRAARHLNALDGICLPSHILAMTWQVTFHPEMANDFTGLSEEVQDALLAHAKLLEAIGPTLGRPAVDTLKGSKIANLKELRFTADGGVWRVAFAFDGRRIAVLLAGGDKAGVSEARFYRALIAKAEHRWRTWE
jgi:hypothetical protein